MSSYNCRHALLYDTFYARKPYRQEAAFVDECLQKFSVRRPERLLELACGTGSHALVLESLGYQITAVDNSPDMLKQAWAKAQEISSRVEFRLQDMRMLDQPEGPFDAAYCLFDSLGY